MMTSVPMTATLPLQTTTESQFTGQIDSKGQTLIHQSDVYLNMWTTGTCQIRCMIWDMDIESDDDKDITSFELYHSSQIAGNNAVSG
jgi:hypothetical protein